MNIKRLLAALTVMLTTILACTLPAGVESTTTPTPTTTANLEAGQTATALILQAEQTATALFSNLSVTITSTIPLTPIDAAPLASVSQNTNCRTGPGVEYDLIGALLVGQQAEVVGKYTPTNYWIIKEPDNGSTCWIWGQYAT